MHFFPQFVQLLSLIHENIMRLDKKIKYLVT